MGENGKRRYANSIDRLPEDIRERLHELLRDPRVTGLEATARINAILEEEGHGERVSKSSVYRYAERMRKIGERMREAQAVADVWVGKLGTAPEGKMGNLVNQMLRALSFDLVMALEEGELTPESLPEVVQMLKDLALSNQRLEKAAAINQAREEEIRRAERERLAESLDQATDGGRRTLDAGQIKHLREQLGL